MKPGFIYKTAIGEIYEPAICDDLFAPVLARIEQIGLCSSFFGWPIACSIALSCSCRWLRWRGCEGYVNSNH